jgi:hypothetical protein
MKGLEARVEGEVGGVEEEGECGSVEKRGSASYDF